MAEDLDNEATSAAAHALLGTIAKLDDAVVASAAPVGSIQGAFRFILAKVSYYVVAAQNSSFMLDVVQSVSACSSPGNGWRCWQLAGLYSDFTSRSNPDC